MDLKGIVHWLGQTAASALAFSLVCMVQAEDTLRDVHLDLDFEVEVSKSGSGGPGVILGAATVVPQVDGSVMIGGDFSYVNGEKRARVTMVDAEGRPSAWSERTALVEELDPYQYYMGVIGTSPLANLFVGGGFVGVSKHDGQTLSFLKHWGDPSPQFFGMVNPVAAARLNRQGDHIVLLKGHPTQNDFTGITRLKAYGPLGTTRIFGVTTGSISCFDLDSEDRIWVGGNFSVAGVGSGLVRLAADGTVDTSFQVEVPGGVSLVVALPGGGLLVGGNFWEVNGIPRSGLAKILPSGEVDSGFQASLPFGSVRSLAVQADGMIWVGGYFSMINGEARSNLARLHSDGSLDLTFDLEVDGGVESLMLSEIGDVYVGGRFSRVDGVERYGVARLKNDRDGWVGRPTISAGNVIVWETGGAAPELGRVLVEGLQPGVGWQLVDKMNRTAVGWELVTDLTAYSLVRVRGLIRGGMLCGSYRELVDYAVVPGREVGLVELTNAAGQRLESRTSVVDFGAAVGLTRGVASTRILTATNRGTAPLEDYLLNPRDALFLKVESASTTPLMPGESRDTTLSLHASKLGSHLLSSAASVVGTEFMKVGLPFHYWGEDAMKPQIKAPYWSSGEVRAAVEDNQGHVWISHSGDKELEVLGETHQIPDILSVIPNDLSPASMAGRPMPNYGFENSSPSNVPRVLQLSGRGSVTPFLARYYDEKLFSFYPRFASDGSLSRSFASLFDIISWLATLPRDRVVVRTWPNEVEILDEYGERDVSIPMPKISADGLHVHPPEIVACGVQKDGKLLLMGVFDRVNGKGGRLLVRLDHTGNVDPTFSTAGFAAAFTIGSKAAYQAFMVVDAEDRILLAGPLYNQFKYPLPGGLLTRLLPNGKLDANFKPGIFGKAIHSVTVSTEGDVIVSGEELILDGDSTPPCSLLVLDRNSGRRSQRFNFPHVTDPIYGAMFQRDGSLLITGRFSPQTLQGGAGLARWPAQSACESSVSQVSPSAIHLRRTGVRGVVQSLACDVWSEGTWKPFGNPTRKIDGWTFEGGLLPENGLVRVRAIVPGGYLNRSSTTEEYLLRLGEEPPAKTIEVHVISDDHEKMPLPEVLDFGTLEDGEVKAIRLRVTNTSDQMIEHLNASVRGGERDAFKISTVGRQLDPGKSADISVLFLSRSSRSSLARAVLLLSHEGIIYPMEISLKGRSKERPVLSRRLRMEVWFDGQKKLTSYGGNRTLNLGFLPLGLPQSLEIRLKNQSSKAIDKSRMDVEAPPLGGLDLSLPGNHSIGSSEIYPGEEHPVPVIFQLTQNGLNVGRYRIGESRLDVRPLTLEIRATAIEQPSVSTGIRDQIVPLYGPLIFGTDFHSVPVPSYVWTHNQRTLRGEVGSRIVRSVASFADAGSYELRVLPAAVHEVPVTVQTARVAVVDRRRVRITALAGKAVVLPPRAAGPISTAWEKAGRGPIPLSSSILTLANVTTADNGEYQCRFLLGDLSDHAGPIEFFVVSGKPHLDLEQGQILPAAALGDAYAFQVPVAGGDDRKPQLFRAQGLPAGMSIDSLSGVIHGAPNGQRSGRNLRVTVVASNAAGVDRRTVILPVVESSTPYAGTYAGLLKANFSNQQLGGRFEIMVHGKGGFSGSLVEGGRRSSLRGVVASQAVGESNYLGRGTVGSGAQARPIRWVLNVAERRLELDSLDTAGGAVNVGHAVVQNFEVDQARASLILRPEGSLPDSGPSRRTLVGSGVATLTVLRSGSYRLVGHTADHQVVTALVPRLVNGEFPFHVPLYGRRLQGVLNGSFSQQPEEEGEAQPIRLVGSGFQIKPASQSRAYPEGFGPIGMTVLGNFLPSSADMMTQGLDQGNLEWPGLYLAHPGAPLSSSFAAKFNGAWSGLFDSSGSFQYGGKLHEGRISGRMNWRAQDLRLRSSSRPASYISRAHFSAVLLFEAGRWHWEGHLSTYAAPSDNGPTSPQSSSAINVPVQGSPTRTDFDE